jgi:hypothetical protein
MQAFLVEKASRTHTHTQKKKKSHSVEYIRIHHVPFAVMMSIGLHNKRIYLLVGAMEVLHVVNIQVGRRYVGSASEPPLTELSLKIPA